MSDWYHDVSANDYKLRLEDRYGRVTWWDATDRRWESSAPEAHERLTKLEMWHAMRMRWRAYYGYYDRTGRSNDYYREIETESVRARSWDPDDDTKDRRLSEICTQAKNAGIVVFTIGFEVTDASADVMRSCASSPQHFYRVEGQDIQYAFSSIKNQINQLKLTQ